MSLKYLWSRGFLEQERVSIFILPSLLHRKSSNHVISVRQIIHIILALKKYNPRVETWQNPLHLHARRCLPPLHLL